LALEAQQNADGVASIAALMTALQNANLQDRVTFVSLNV
jgi:hypothetical protein